MGRKFAFTRRQCLAGGALCALLHAETALMGCSTADENPLLLDDFYDAEDGLDIGPAFNRAFAAGLKQHRHIVAAPGKRYRLFTTVNIRPDVEGWTPHFYGQNCTVIMGKEVPDITDEWASFRYRGIHSGEIRNVTSGLLRDFTIDANNIGIDPSLPRREKPSFSNGIIGILTENADGVVINNVDGINYLQGYHVLFFRYADGGALPGRQGNKFLNSRVSGAAGRTNVRSHWNTKWFAHSSSSDLTVGYPGGVLPDGEAVPIATPRVPPFGTGLNGATPYYWENRSGAAVVIPDILSESNLIAAGLTRGRISNLADDYIETGGRRVARAVVEGAADEASGIEVNGGYYGLVSIGTRGHRINHCRMLNNVRGFAAEWSAKELRIGMIQVKDNLSSGVLLGYGCSGWRAEKIAIDSAVWLGEGLLNIQLGSGEGWLGRLETNTNADVTTGQTHIHIACDCSNVYVGPSRLRGSCAKAYVSVESAWNTRTDKRVKELYQAAADGFASIPMSNIHLDGIEIEVNSRDATVPTAFALLQVNDAIHGPIALSDVRLTRCRAVSEKHIHALKVLESADEPLRNGATGFVLADCTFSSAPAVEFELPRGRAHFKTIAGTKLS